MLEQLVSNSLKTKHLRIWLYSVWAVLVFLQAGLTELIDDEAYYWVYANHLDWGHFHQPPMVAFWIKIGFSVFQHEIGVRLLFVAAHLATIWLIESLTDKRNPVLLAVLVVSIGIFHWASYFAVPDTPFVFFTALFFWLAKRYLQAAQPAQTWRWAVLLGITVAGMLYSKYHSVVVLFFVILSDFRLFRRPSFYAIGIIGLLLFLPHLYWEWQHDFVTFQFHWTERNQMAWNIGLTLGYIGGVLLIFGPFIGFILLWQMWRCRPENDFERMLKTVFWGILGFFFAMSLRGRVEANWVIAGAIPLLILTHSRLQRSNNAQIWVYRLLPLSLVVALVGRFVLAFNVLPNSDFLMKFRDFHGVEGWVRPIEKAVQKEGNLPVIFATSYQIPSKYSFYTRSFATSLAPSTAPRTQFDLYHWDEDLQGKDVIYFWNYGNLTDSTVVTTLGTFQYRVIRNFRSYANVQIQPTQPQFTFPKGQTATIPILMTADQPVDFQANTNIRSTLCYQIFQNDRMVTSIFTDIEAQTVWEATQQGKPFPLLVELPDQKGKFRLKIAIQTRGIFPTHNCPAIPLELE